MKKNKLNLASQLFDAYHAGVVPPLRTQVEDTSVDLAYCIQQENHLRWVLQGRRAIGCKIGLTSKAVQKQLGVDQPDYGIVYADSCYASGESIAIDNFLQPRIEAEIAFVLKEDLTSPMLTIVDIMNSIDYAVAALEIVDSRITNWDISLFDTIADNASYGGIVMGTKPISLCDLDLEACNMKLFKGSEKVSSGVGSACLGNPLLATLWLAKTMVNNGRPLRAGEVVLSGALGPMVPVQVGDTFTAEIDGLNRVSVSFI